jgi:TetR/AcrR family transcriptional regulator, cholesterol catabolism regulator
LSTERLTERQEARRQRILDAAYRLVTEGSYELVQMRDVARLADVAPRTVYHYFSSKDHLVAAAVAQWTSRFTGRPNVRSIKEDTNAGRLIAAMHQRALTLERYPNVAKALLYARASPDPAAIACSRDSSEAVEATFHAALAGLPDDQRIKIIRVVGAVWGSWLADWVHGHASMPSVLEAIDEAVHLLVDPIDEREARGAGQTTSVS